MQIAPQKSAIIAAMVCAIAVTSPANAQVSPDIINLLTIAAEKDNGANLDIVTNLAIAANPAAEKDIRALVENLKKQASEKKASAASTAMAKTDAAKTDAAMAPLEEDHGIFSFAGWDGEAELNFLQTSGNTRQQSFGLAGKLKRDADKFHHIVAGFFDLNKNQGNKDKQKWGLSYKLDYDFSKKLYITGFAGYENDQFGPFRERIITTLGLGYPIIKTADYSWKFEAGPSILFTKELPGDSYNSSVNAFASSLFSWIINDRSSLDNNTIIFFGNKTVVESKSALKVKINGALSSKFSFDILYDKEAPLGRKSTDTVARAGLLYDF